MVGKILRIKHVEQLPSYKEAADLDDLDRAILEKHQEDMSFLYSDLAKKFNVTSSTIRNRIKRLKAAGVMDLILVMNPYKIGFRVFAVLGLKAEPSADLDRMISTFLKSPRITNLQQVTGRYDFIIHCVFLSMDDFRQFIDVELHEIPGIADVEPCIGLDMYQRKFDLGIIGKG